MDEDKERLEEILTKVQDLSDLPGLAKAIKRHLGKAEDELLAALSLIE